MEIQITKEAYKDYKFWELHDEKKHKRVQKLLKTIKNDPFKGIGKPEALKFDLQGYWSRRIDKQHRLVYTVEGSVITIISCRYHYAK
jgi:toxin YoeB